MTHRDDLLGQVAAANPLTADAPLPNGIADDRPPLASLLDTLEREGARTAPDTPPRRWRRLIVPATAVVVAALIAAPLLLTGGEEETAPPVAGEAITVTVEGFNDGSDLELAGVLYEGLGLERPDTRVIGGFAGRVGTGTFAAAEQVRQPHTDPFNGMPFPYVTDEVLVVEPGTYTLMIWLGNDLGPYSRWVPAESPGLVACQSVIEVTDGRATSVTVVGGFGTVADFVPYCATSAVPTSPIEGLAGSGDSVWAWNSDGRIALYDAGSWAGLPPLPDPVVDVAGSLADGVWAITTSRCDGSEAGAVSTACETRLWSLTGGEWRPNRKWGPLPDNLVDVEVDPTTGTVWIVSAEGLLYRWDGSQMTSIVSDSQSYVDRIAVTRDGEVWASWFNPFFPDIEGLVRLDRQRGSWDPVRPLGGNNRHALITSTPSGNLAVWLPVPLTGISSHPPALAYYHAASGRWTVHDGETPPKLARAIAATDEDTWLATGAGILHFDGETWARFDLNRREIIAIAGASDGSVWYVTGRALYELGP